MAGQYLQYALQPEVDSPPGSGFSAMAQTDRHTDSQNTDIADSRLDWPKSRISEKIKIPPFFQT